MKTNHKISKRKFIKSSLLAFGGSMLYTKSGLSSISSKFTEYQESTSKDQLWKWSKEAMFFEETARGIKCKVCPNECEVKLNELSVCHTRINHKGKLYTIAYGNPCAVHIDPIEKKPFFHYKPTSRALSIATAGCNFACLNCQNWEISQKSPKETQNEDLMPNSLVNLCISEKCESIAYTYTEPIVYYEYTYDTAKIARSKGIKNVIVSAGFISPEPLKEWCKYIDAATIDLKGFDEKTYAKLNAGKLQPVLDALKIYKENNVWLEISNLVVPSWTDNLDNIKKMCDWLFNNGFSDTPLHFLRFHPMYKLTQLPSTPVATLEKAREIAMAAGIKFVYLGNVPGTKAENTYCPKCKKIVVERKGFFIISKQIEKNKCRFCGENIPGVWA